MPLVTADFGNGPQQVWQNDDGTYWSPEGTLSGTTESVRPDLQEDFAKNQYDTTDKFYSANPGAFSRLTAEQAAKIKELSFGHSAAELNAYMDSIRPANANNVHGNGLYGNGADMWWGPAPGPQHTDNGGALSTEGILTGGLSNWYGEQAQNAGNDMKYGAVIGALPFVGAGITAAAGAGSVAGGAAIGGTETGVAAGAGTAAGTSTGAGTLYAGETASGVGSSGVGLGGTGGAATGLGTEAGALTGAETGALTSSTGEGALTGTAGEDTLAGDSMDFSDLNFDDFGFDPGGEGLSNAPMDPGGGGAFDTGGSEGVFDSQGNPIANSSDGGAFDMGGSEGVFDAQGNPIANSGNFLQQIATKYGAQALGYAQKLLAGDPEAMKKLLSLGVPAAAVAGLFENNKSPLIASQVNASRGALAGADKFAALPDIGLTPSQTKAIETANADAGAWKPYFDKAGALADVGAGGITEETTNKYLNPELQGVLDPTIRDLQEAADTRRQQLRAEVARSGNDFYAPGTEPTRFNVSDSLLDRELFRGISDATGKIRSQAWTDATTLAGKDLDRNLTASNLYGGLGKSAGALGSVDFQNLAGAGALERQPAEDARTHAADTSKLYTGVVSGINPAVAGSTPQSTLSKATGALGALSTAKDIGLY